MRLTNDNPRLRTVLMVMAIWFSALPGGPTTKAYAEEHDAVTGYSREDRKPVALIFLGWINGLAAYSAAGEYEIAIFQIQQHLGVSRNRAEELMGYLSDLDRREDREMDEVAAEVLCPTNRPWPSGYAVGVAENQVNGVQRVVPQKYLELTKTYLTEDEVARLMDWLEEMQPKVTIYTTDRTKTTPPPEQMDHFLEQRCTNVLSRLQG